MGPTKLGANTVFCVYTNRFAYIHVYTKPFCVYTRIYKPLCVYTNSVAYIQPFFTYKPLFILRIYKPFLRIHKPFCVYTRIYKPFLRIYTYIQTVFAYRQNIVLVPNFVGPVFCLPKCPSGRFDGVHYSCFSALKPFSIRRSGFL